MKKNLKSLMPQAVAPVQRETSATVSRGSACAIAAIAALHSDRTDFSGSPFAGDDAE